MGGRESARPDTQASARPPGKVGSAPGPKPLTALYFFADTSFPLPYLRPLGSFSPPSNSSQQPQRETAPAAATGPLLTIPAAGPTVRRGGGGGGARMPLTLGPAPAPRPPPPLAKRGGPGRCWVQSFLTLGRTRPSASESSPLPRAVSCPPSGRRESRQGVPGAMKGRCLIGAAAEGLAG